MELAAAPHAGNDGWAFRVRRGANWMTACNQSPSARILVEGEEVPAAVEVHQGAEQVLLMVRPSGPCPIRTDSALALELGCGPGVFVTTLRPPRNPERDETAPGWRTSPVRATTHVDASAAKWAPRDPSWCEAATPKVGGGAGPRLDHGAEGSRWDWPERVSGTPVLICWLRFELRPNESPVVILRVEAVTDVGGARVVRSTWVLDPSMPLMLAAIVDRRGGDRALVPGPGKVELHITPYDLAGNEGEARCFLVDLSTDDYWGERERKAALASEPAKSDVVLGPRQVGTSTAGCRRPNALDFDEPDTNTTPTDETP